VHDGHTPQDGAGDRRLSGESTVNHHPRIYDVEGEPPAIRIWDGEKDLWFPITWGELRNIVEDGQDALFRQMRKMEKG
jgi:hypothetical protein